MERKIVFWKPQSEDEKQICRELKKQRETILEKVKPIIVKMKEFKSRIHARKVIRAGTIPWCVDKDTGEKKFWFGVHHDPQQITDLAGIMTRQDFGNPITTAQREWSEEGCNAWGQLDVSSFYSSIVVVNNNMLNIFIKIPDFDIDNIKKKFQQNSVDALHKEVIDLECLSQGEILSILKGEISQILPFYSKTFSFLSELGNFDFLDT
jgi:hypothetical protein